MQPKPEQFGLPMPEQGNPILDQLQSSSRVWPVVLRCIAMAVLILAELAVSRFFLAFPETSAGSEPVARLIASVNQNISVSTTGAFIVASTATLLLIVSRRLGSVVNSLLDQPGYSWWPWLAGHVVAFMVFIRLSWPVFGPAASGSELSVTWLAGWLAAGAATLICLFLAVAPLTTWLRLARQERLAAILAVIAGSIAWAGGQLMQQLWKPMTDITLWCTYKLLSLFYADVYVNPAMAILGVNSFVVEIAPSCSGFEGIALITVFVTLYLWLFRKELRFPAALLLLPIGIIVIWITNILRIVMLVSIGASFSPAIAIGGFHSQAGWIGFSIVALGIIFLAHRSYLASPADTGALPHEHVSDAALAPSRLMPLLALMGSSMLGVAFSSDFAFLYPVSVIVTAGVVWYFRSSYKPLLRVPSWHGVTIGIAVGVIWLLIVPVNEISRTTLGATLANMPTWLAAGWITFRIIGSVFTVPIAEELAFRGYLLHKLVRTDFENVKPGSFTWLSFLLSSVLFGLMHDSWLAGTLAGAGFALALYQRGQLVDAIVAHITSNALVAAAVLGTGRWELWG